MKYTQAAPKLLVVLREENVVNRCCFPTVWCIQLDLKTPNPDQNCSHFSFYISLYIFCMKINVFDSNFIEAYFGGFDNNNPCLVQTLSWYITADKSLSKPMIVIVTIRKHAPIGHNILDQNNILTTDGTVWSEGGHNDESFCFPHKYVTGIWNCITQFTCPKVVCASLRVCDLVTCIDGLVQDCSISGALTMEVLLSCTKSLVCSQGPHILLRGMHSVDVMVQLVFIDGNISWHESNDIWLML